MAPIKYTISREIICSIRTATSEQVLIAIPCSSPSETNVVVIVVVLIIRSVTETVHVSRSGQLLVSSSLRTSSRQNALLRLGILIRAFKMNFQARIPRRSRNSLATKSRSPMDASCDSTGQAIALFGQLIAEARRWPRFFCLDDIERASKPTSARSVHFQ